MSTQSLPDDARRPNYGTYAENQARANAEYARIAALPWNGRYAKCGCGKTEKSSSNLWFFEDLSEGDGGCVHCGYTIRVHMMPMPRGAWLSPEAQVCTSFEERMPEFDRYYCSCRGTD